MHMNKRNLSLALFLGALVIALVALPGNSAKLQNPETSPKEVVESKILLQDDGTEELAQPVADQDESWQQVQDIERVEVPEISDDVEVFIGGGSWLGVETSEVTATQVKEFKLSAERGVLVGKIVPDSPAAKAGLKERDVITELNGQRVEGTAQFRRMIREIPAGRTELLTLFRDGRSKT